MLASFALITLLAPKEAAVRKELASDYAAISRHFSKGDIPAIAKLLTDDYVVDDGQKVTTRAEVLDSFKKLVTVMHETSWKRDISKLTLAGNKAVAMVSGDFRATYIEPQSKKSHLFNLHADSTDTWLKTPAGYKLQKSRITSHRIEVDGKIQPGSL